MVKDWVAYSRAAGLPEREADLPIAWASTVTERGIGNLPVPAADQLEQDLEAIRDFRKFEPELYERAIELRAVERKMLEADLAYSTVAGPPPSEATNRLADIRAISKNDPEN